MNSNSPAFESSVPSWRDFSLRVNRGPHSTRSARVPSSLNWYLCYLKKMKSRWLWRVIILRALTLGVCGKSDASMRPIRWPNIVSKLLRMSSGFESPGAAPCLNIWLRSFTLETRKFAVGPSGRWLNIKESAWWWLVVKIVLTRNAVLLVEEQEVCKPFLLGLLYHALDLVVLPLIIFATWNCWLDFLQEIE